MSHNGKTGSSPFPGAPRPPSAARSRWPFVVVLACVVLVSDQATKVAALYFLGNHAPHRVLGTWLYFNLAHNPGGAFGLLPGAAVYLAVASAVIVVTILLYVRAAAGNSRLLAAALGMLLGGALGNLADRLRLGHVVDFIDLRVWPIFNVADIGITAGVALVVLSVFLQRPARKPARSHPDAEPVSHSVEPPHASGQ